MKQLLTITLLLLLITMGFSQNERVHIKGKITYLDIPIENVNISNLTSHFGETSNSTGEFEIFVKENDTLKVSHLEYQTKKIIISKKNIEEKTLNIALKEMTNYLNTVNLKSHDLTGNLVKDVQNNTNDTIAKKHDLIEEMMRMAKMPSNKDYETNFEKPPMNNVDPVGNFGAGGAVGIPIPDKANDFRRKLRAKKSFPNKLISDLGEDFFTKELKIPKDRIYHFITFCESRNIRILYKSNKIIQLITVLKEESEKYNEIG